MRPVRQPPIRASLEDRHPVAETAQIVRCHQAGGTGSDHGNRLGPVVVAVQNVPWGPRLPLRQEPLDVPHPHRGVGVDALAVLLARVRADVAQDARKREPSSHQLERLAKAPGGSELHVAPGIDAERTPGDAVGGSLTAAMLENALRQP